jgi:hypothetical protein
MFLSPLNEAVLEKVLEKEFGGKILNFELNS